MEQNLDDRRDFVGTVQQFAAGWRAPHPHAWDDLLATDVELTQPLLADGRGIAVWQGEVARLLAFIPDVHGEVLDWAGRGDTLFIDLELRGTAGGRPLSFRAVDRLTIGAAGTVVRRESFFDPTSLSATVVRRPRAWLRWWRSGLGPLLWRRRVLGKVETT
jgi:hypothetical protein